MSNIDKHAVQAVADLKAGYRLGHADVAILNELARIALASLEAEPVAWLLSGGGAKNNVSFDSGNAYADPLREVTPLYTAPPAPVSVPAAMEMDDDFDSAFEHGKAVGWNAYRAAMLQGAEPVTKAYKLLDDFDFDRFNDVVWLEAVASNPHMHSLTTSTIAMVALELNRKLADRNSTVIQDGWVACSERLPPEGYEPDGGAVCYLVWHKNEVDCGPLYSISNVFFLRKHWEKNFTHWMPLPAAPQQEVK
ncbi:DUF551 domain-containing protein [Enterobacter hormaechei]|uniref:DUF551 domain-containing protein n=1 Tax=Enterobacter hormaechei TaxID=158836 RepID=A0AAX3Z5F0_9ENTR|nr:DUF551 domain-containing protein [Enterobacter hormaechei]UAS95640.1 DUF551 domain-containing protein [Enterobacter cloacae complex sp.]HAT3923056.1 DUF551 domain-containing protein [Citrobacter amalonaticus]ELT5715682.1 DUF551 domain-containing protein [Enterobacter hormaechei]MCE1429985.1 DUF551 domain-containing protein [Enterobacter hormaechei]MCM7734606.1 DUF551 domain-containing protein [Enterobacter hormaechei]